MASSKAFFTSSGGRAFCRVKPVTFRPVRYRSSDSCRWSRAAVISRLRSNSTVSMVLLPTTSRTALSAAFCKVSRPCMTRPSTLRSSRKAYRNSRGSLIWYWALNLMSTMFSSRVSTRTWSSRPSMRVASTIVTVSTGQGHLKFGPGVMIRLNSPKRSTTPRWRSSTSLKLLKTRNRPIRGNTQASGLPPPPPMKSRRRWNRPSRPPPPPPPLPLPPQAGLPPLPG